MIDQPNAQERIPGQEKLILPAYPDDEQRINGNQVSPGQLIHRDTTPPPADPFAKLSYFWRKDPAYKVLIIAVTTVVVAGLLFGILASVVILQSSNTFTTAPTSTQGTADLHPTFPTPSGGSGSDTSSQPPAYSTPALNPSPVVTVTPVVTITPVTTGTPVVTTTPITQPTPQPGALSIQITNAPNPVLNGSTVDVGVMASGANVVVSIQVYYNARPYVYMSEQGVTDSNGIVTIPWHVQVSRRGPQAITATLVAIATNQQGERIGSAPVTVLVTTNTGG